MFQDFTKTLSSDSYAQAQVSRDFKVALHGDYSEFEDLRVSEHLRWVALAACGAQLLSVFVDFDVVRSRGGSWFDLAVLVDISVFLLYVVCFFLFREGSVFKFARSSNVQSLFFGFLIVETGIYWLYILPGYEQAVFLFLITLLIPAFMFSVAHYLLLAGIAAGTFVLGQLGVVGKITESAEIQKIFDICFFVTIACSSVVVVGRRRNLKVLYRALGDLNRERAATANMAKLSALGEMAGGIAHEINNPLAIIQGKVGQMLRMLEKEGLRPEWLKDELQKVVDTTKRISRIIDGLRSFSRSGEKDPFEPVSSKKIVTDTLAFCSEKFRTNGVELRFDEGVDVLVHGRFVQLAQVLLNLVGNAYDAIHDLEDRWVEIRVEDKGSFVEIRVIDSGRGIPPEVAAKIMQPFFTTKEIGKGTGLGLSISKGIVEEHGGTLDLDLACENTCFVIRLPKFANQNSKLEKAG